MKEVPLAWQLLLQFALILLNAVFACAEIAIISMNDAKLAKLQNEGNKKVDRLIHLVRQPSRFLSTIQVAITLSGFLGSAFAADNFAKRLVNWLVNLGVSIPVSTLNTLAIIVVTIILSFFTLVFGELVPKRLAMQKAESLALALSGFISVMSKLFKPIVSVLTASTNVILRLFGVDPYKNDEDVTEEEIRMLVDVGSEKGAIDKVEKEWIQNVFEFDDITAGEIATHRTDLVVLWEKDNIVDWENIIRDNRHTLYPICGDNIDTVKGILNTKDYFRIEKRTKEVIYERAVSPAYFIPESVKADMLFRNMKSSRNHFAVVLDEYGGVFGVVTMSDLLEQLLGDLDDDASQPIEVEIRQIEEDQYRILGSTAIDDAEEVLGVSLPVDNYDTFGGFILGTYGTIPKDGEPIAVDFDRLSIRNIVVKDRRVEQADVTVTPETDEADDEEE